MLIGAVSAAPLDQPAPEVVAEARSIIQQMVVAPRGPYSRIRWYCNDGTTQEPVAYACIEHGGGRQHAEYSAKRQRLVQLGWSVGTIFANLTFTDLFESAPRQQRLRELALEKYLIDVDNGWVLRNARGYRGRVQVEDEEAAGRKLLLELFSDSAWVESNFLLARESARVIPHGEDSNLARSVRRAAVEIAEMDPAAERWRAEIHSAPSAQTADRLRAWLAQKNRPRIAEMGERLAADMDRLYGTSGRRGRITASLDKLKESAISTSWRTAVVRSLSQVPNERLPQLCRALAQARSSLVTQLGLNSRLALVDVMQDLESEVQLTYQEIRAGDELSRGETLRLSLSLVDCAFASGLISPTEHAALGNHLKFDDADVLSIMDYKNAVTRLKRVPNWGVGTVRHTFSEALIKYAALEPRAMRFSDDLLRGSPMWMLGDTLKVLAKDLDYLLGSVVKINGEAIATAVALNGGVARGKLRIFETIDAIEGATLNPTDIVILPETVAELSPVAGILTLGEGNALSHVQLLARNFGIPNVAIDQETVDLVKPLENLEVFLVVDDNGNVLLRKEDPDAIAIFSSASNRGATAFDKITVPVPDLSMKKILPLVAIRRDLSGKVIGPKAANLGELNHLFPGRVAPAVAIPFGVYADHLQDGNLMGRVRSVFAANARGEISKPEFDTELADVRKQIAALKLSGTQRSELIESMRSAFGEPGTYGVFVRSDTNVEDLPQFTGAGLNETVPNVVGLDAQLSAVTRVWSSVFSPRALAWRSSVLSNPDQIYASVLLLKSVPSTKSGVLVTANLFDRSAPALTVSTAWGVGGAVAGEPAESIVIFDDRVDVYSEAKSPYQRNISSSGGVDWVPAPAGPVLTEKELIVLRQLAEEVRKKYAPVFDETGKPRPWDIEFGFVDGELTLFQIRPLVERGNRNTEALLRKLEPAIGSAVRTGNVPLQKLPGT